MDPIVVPLFSRRLQRVQVVQKLNHGIPAIGLIVAGMQALQEGARGFDLGLAIIEIATSAALILTIAQAMRGVARAHARPHAPHGVDWIDLWAAAVLFTEAAERWHLKHHVARPILLTAIVTLGVGVFHGRIMQLAMRRRALRVTADGVYVGDRHLFRGFSARWNELEAVTMTDRSAEIRTRSGRVRKIDLADLDNADAVRAALTEARRLLGARARDQPALPSR